MEWKNETFTPSHSSGPTQLVKIMMCVEMKAFALWAYLLLNLFHPPWSSRKRWNASTLLLSQSGLNRCISCTLLPDSRGLSSCREQVWRQILHHFMQKNGCPKPTATSFNIGLQAILILVLRIQTNVHTWFLKRKYIGCRLTITHILNLENC